MALFSSQVPIIHIIITTAFILVSVDIDLFLSPVLASQRITTDDFYYISILLKFNSVY